MQELYPDTLAALPRRLRSIGSLDPGKPVSKATRSDMAHSHVEAPGLDSPEGRHQDGSVTFEVLCMAPDCQTRIAVRTQNSPVMVSYTALPGVQHGAILSIRRQPAL